jgi:hypothetical protein
LPIDAFISEMAFRVLISLRLQELHEQVNRLRDERLATLSLQEGIREVLQQNSRKLDLILATLRAGDQMMA